MKYRKTLHYRNSTVEVVKLILEPWGENYSLAPNDAIEVVGEGEEDGYFEMEQTQDALFIFGWVGSIVSIKKDGKDLEQDAQSN